MKSAAMFFDCIAVCQGTTPMMATFIVRYSTATITTDRITARGIVLLGPDHLVAQVADVVVAEVVVDGDQHRAAQAGEESLVESEGIGRKRDQRRVEIRQPGDDHGQQRDQRAGAQHDGQPAPANECAGKGRALTTIAAAAAHTLSPRGMPQTGQSRFEVRQARRPGSWLPPM